MKKTLIKILILTSITSLTFGCNKKKEDNSQAEQKAEIVENKFIVKNSHSDYSIVIPKKYKEKERLAAETINSYLNKSSGAKLSVIYDNEVLKGSHYISIGNTSVFNSEFKDVSMNELDGKISSYFISTKDENIYIYSNPNERAEGSLYGAYDFLHELINYEYYASDEVYYTNEANINLRNYKNFFIHPTFDGRSVGNYHLIHNQDVCENYRIINQYRGTEWVSDIYGHSQVTSFIRPQDPFVENYKNFLTEKEVTENYDPGVTIHDKHSDWFSNRAATVADTTNNQLCWSSGEELGDYVAFRFIQYFKKYPDATYFMFGQEDNSTSFCNCSECQKAMREYAVNYAGLQIVLMNHVIEKTEAWLAKFDPGRQVRYVVFGYHATKSAPCVKKDNKWVPANDLVVPNKKLYILYAPISCNFAFPLENNYFNSEAYLELNQWNQVAGGRLMIYFYDVNFRNYFANFYNFSTVKAMYKMCKDLGVSYMYTQGATDTATSCFSTMREYVESKLMWNINLKYDDLVQDFMSHYYFDARDELYEYYQTVRDRLSEFHVEKADGGGIYSSIATKAIYPYSILRYFTTLFDKALEKIDHYRLEDLDFYNNLKARIMREYLSVIYLKMSLAKSEISDAEKEKMKEIFMTYIGYFGITRTFEGSPLIDIEELFS